MKGNYSITPHNGLKTNFKDSRRCLQRSMFLSNYFAEFQTITRGSKKCKHYMPQLGSFPSYGAKIGPFFVGVFLANYPLFRAISCRQSVTHIQKSKYNKITPKSVTNFAKIANLFDRVRERANRETPQCKETPQQGTRKPKQKVLRNILSTYLYAGTHCLY